MARRSEEETRDEGSAPNGTAHTGGDDEKQDLSKKPVGFWHSDLRKTRNNVFRNWAGTTLLLMMFILAVLSLYWGVLSHVEKNMSALVVWVVDFDSQVAPYTSTTPIVGPAIVQAAQQTLKPTGTVGWGSLPASAFDNDPMLVRSRIYDYKAWAAVIINANATTLLQNAIATGNVSYNPMGAAQIVYVQARDEMTHANYVVPQFLQFQSQVTQMFGEMWAGQVLSRASNDATLLANLQAVPQALNPAIGFSTYNLRPFYPPVATPAITIGLIYLIIIAFFSFAFYMPHHIKFIKPEIPVSHRPMHPMQQIIWRWVSTIVAYFFLSLAYSLISLAFQINFTAPPGSHTELVQPATQYGRGSFVVYWMVNFVGMIALGLASENVTMILGQPWTSFWLIFWVITNVSTSFYSITLAPMFYYWGYAWPLHNIVEASRTILFNVHSEIGLNFGILFAWCAVNTALFPLCCMFLAKKQKKEQEKEQAKDE